MDASCFESKKHRKGSVTYSIKSNNQRSGRTTAQAKIAFLGAAPIVTGRTATQWRQKSLHAKPGFTFGLNRDAIPETDSLAAGNWHNRLSLAIGYQNAPIGTGLVYGLELATTRHRFYQDTTTLVAPDGGFLPNGGYLFQSQSFDIRYLELKAVGGWQFEGLVRGSAGLGIAVPAFARLSGRAMASFEPTFKDPVYTTRSSKQYGLFQDRNDPVFLFNQPLENKPSPGLSWHFTVEAGLTNEASLGLEWQTRFFPNFYRGGCATFSNFNATLRFKFGVLGGKNQPKTLITYEKHLFRLPPGQLQVSIPQCEIFCNAPQSICPFTLRLDGDMVDGMAVRSAGGQILDGDLDGSDGGDFIRTVGENGLFDCGYYTLTVTEPLNGSSAGFSSVNNQGAVINITFSENIDTNSVKAEENIFLQCNAEPAVKRSGNITWCWFAFPG